MARGRRALAVTITVTLLPSRRCAWDIRAHVASPDHEEMRGNLVQLERLDVREGPRIGEARNGRK